LRHLPPRSQQHSSEDSTRQSSILQLVRDGLDEGRLWLLEAAPVWFGHGAVKPCAVCRFRISVQGIQYDLPVPRGTGTVPVHEDCYRMWLFESDRRR
jgi:hypothetical protein